MIYLRRIGFALGMSILTSVFALILGFFIFTSYPSNQSYISEGDHIIVTSPDNSPVHAELYSENSDGITEIKDLEGKVVLATEAGVMKGYYDARGDIKTGAYIVSGSGANITISDGARIDNPGVEKRNHDVTWLMVKAMFIVGAIVWLLVSPVFVQNTRQ